MISLFDVCMRIVTTSIKHSYSLKVEEIEEYKSLTDKEKKFIDRIVSSTFNKKEGH